MNEPFLTHRLAEALDLAVELHRSQIRKKGPGETGPDVPYLSHLLAVTALVLAHGGDEDEAVAALLHDGPEDQGGRPVLERIRRRFGERVARIVESCSDTFEAPKPEWLERKRTYIAHLRDNAPGDDVLLVSLADKVHNVGSIVRDRREVGEAVWKRFTAGRKGTLWYYRTLERIFRERDSERTRPLATELSRLLDELDPERSGASAEPT